MENNENIVQETIEETETPIVPEEEIQEEVAEEVVADAPEYEEPVIEEPQYVPPTPKKKGRGKKVLKVLLISLLIIAFVAGSCFVTALFVSSYWEYQLRQVVGYMQYGFAELQQQIEDSSYTGNGNSISGTPNATEGLTPAQIHAQNKNSVVGISNQSV